MGNYSGAVGFYSFHVNVRDVQEPGQEPVGYDAMMETVKKALAEAGLDVEIERPRRWMMISG